MDLQILGNPLRAWLTAFAVVAVVLIILSAVRTMALRRLRALAERTATEIDDLAVDLLEHVHALPLVAVALAVSSGFLDLRLHPRFAHALNVVVVVAVAIQAVIWGNSVIAFWSHRYIRRRGITDPGSVATINALTVVARGVVAVAVVLLGLDNLGIQVTALLTAAGIGGIAIALAVQNVLSDLLAALSIVLDKPFVVGDSIAVDTFRGEVQHIGLKTTRVRSVDGEQIIFSNADLLRSRIRNFRQLRERRVSFTTRIVYWVSPAQAARVPVLIREIVERQAKARFERSHFVRYGEAALEFETVYVVVTPSYDAYLDIQQSINLGLMERLAAEGIGLASPPRTPPAQSSPAA